MGPISDSIEYLIYEDGIIQIPLSMLVEQFAKVASLDEDTAEECILASGECGGVLEYGGYTVDYLVNLIRVNGMFIVPPQISDEVFELNETLKEIA